MLCGRVTNECTPPCLNTIFDKISYSHGLEGIWIVLVYVKEKPSVWEGFIRLKAKYNYSGMTTVSIT